MTDVVQRLPDGTRYPAMPSVTCLVCPTARARLDPRHRTLGIAH